MQWKQLSNLGVWDCGARWDGDRLTVVASDGEASAAIVKIDTADGSMKVRRVGEVPDRVATWAIEQAEDEVARCRG